MDNFNLPEALLQYRLRERLTQNEMGKILDMSRQAYDRLEKGKRKPTYDEVPVIMDKLELKIAASEIVAIPNLLPQWYQSKKWRWVIPIAISYLFLSLMTETVGFREGYGVEKFQTNPPTAALIIIGALFCAIYWYYYTPEWPFKNKGN